MGKHLNSLEKEVLIKRFQANPNVSIRDFCIMNGISLTAFRGWIKKYNTEGIEGLINKNRADKVSTMFPKDLDVTEEDLKREIMKLRIENERLKKSYIVEKTPDGGSVYKHLRKKNSK